MKTIKFTAYLFYRYYSKHIDYYGKYGHTIMSLVILLFLHLIQLLLFINNSTIFSYFLSPNKLADIINFALLLSPGIILFLVFLRESDLQTMSYDDALIKKGNIYLIAYIILSMALLVFLIYYRK